MNIPSSKIDSVLNAFRLWYNRPCAVSISYDQINKTQELIPLSIRSSNIMGWNYPTQLCIGCGKVRKDYSVGFTSPSRFRCGECCHKDYKPTKEFDFLKGTNPYVWNFVMRFIELYPTDFYTGNDLTAFRSLNATTMELNHSLEEKMK